MVQKIMRRTLFLSLFFQCLFLLKSEAQLYVGPVLGGSLSKVYFFDSQFRFKSLPSLGFDAGIMASFKVQKNFRLNAELLFARRTKNIVGTSGPGVDSQFSLTANMDFIELPIFYALEFKNVSGGQFADGGKQKVYNWYVGAGPVVSYWLSNKGRLKSSNLLETNIDHVDYKGAFGSDDQSAPSNVEIMPSVNRLQFGLNITGGLAFEPVAGRKIMTSLQLYLMQTFLGESDGKFPGSTPLQKNQDDSDVLKARNYSLRFSVAYLFDTKVEKRKKGQSTIPTRDVRRKKR